MRFMNPGQFLNKFLCLEMKISLVAINDQLREIRQISTKDGIAKLEWLMNFSRNF